MRRRDGIKCSEAKLLLSPCVDGAVTGSQFHSLTAHLEHCADCRNELTSLSNAQRMLSSLGRKHAPPDLALRLRVVISREAAKKCKPRFDAFLVHLQNAFTPFMVPATAGAISAVIIFGILIGMLTPLSLRGAADVPANYTPPQLRYSPFGFVMNSINTDKLVVEAYVDADGRVQDYRILSAPENAEEIMPELKNMLIFTVFRPATSFGRPISARVVLSFSKINVKG